MKILSSMSLVITIQMISSILSGNATYLPSQFLCTNEQSNITIGNNVTICIHFLPRFYRMAFNVTADEYSVLSIGGGYDLVAEDTLNQTSFVFQIAANTTAYPSLYYNKPSQFIVPLFNVVIKVNKGVIYDIVWDNDCFSCLTSSQCYTNANITYMNDTSIYTTEKNCVSNLCTLNATDAFNCDPKFYITWFGTDANGKQLQSSNLSMSRFRQYSVGSLYNSAKDIFNQTMIALQNTWGDVTNKTLSLLT